MQTEFSSYLTGIAPGLKRLIALLGDDFDYASALATDSKGFAMRVGQRNMSVANETMTTERGIVLRLYKDGLYTEYALNRFDPEKPEEAAFAAKKAREEQAALLAAAGVDIYETGILPDEPKELFAAFETEETPEGTDQEALLTYLKKVSDEGMQLSENLVDVRLIAQSTHISKLFLTKNRDLRQTYVYSEAAVFPIAQKDGKMVSAYGSVSGRVGPELFAKLSGKVADAVKNVEELVDALMFKPDISLDYMCNLYRQFILTDHSVREYSKFVHILLDEHDKAILWHCTAGKDRAGTSAIIVEKLLGVSDEDILKDYLDTNENIKDEMLNVVSMVKKKANSDSPLIDKSIGYLFGADEAYLDAFFSAMDERFGGFDAFVHKGLGLGDSDLIRLENLYLD